MANLSIWQIIQPTLNQNKHRVINSYKFAQEAKTWAIDQDEAQVLHDVVNYPSVPVYKTISVLTDTLNNDKEQLKECKKITLTDRHKLTELFFSKRYFLYENNLRLFQNSGPIEFSLMIELLESYSQKIERKAIMETMNYKILPKTFKRFVDYSQAHFQHFQER